MKKIIFTLLFLFFFVTCNTVKNKEMNTEGFVHISKSRVFWPNPQNIPVCWEPIEERYIYNYDRRKIIATKDELIKLQKNLQDVAVKEYQRAGLQLRGWDLCKPDSLGIRILWSTQGSMVNLFGNALNGIKNGMWFEVPSIDSNGLIFTHIEIVYMWFLHELGHAVGLRHEQARRDGRHYENDKENYIFDEPGASKLGIYDKISIMNYGLESILLEYLEKKKKIPMPTLSTGDINTLKNLYYFPTAIIPSSTQIRYSPETTKIEVQSVPNYFYKIVENSAETCQVFDEYLGPFKSSDSISVDLNTHSGKDIYICVLGKNKDTIQLLEAFTSIEISVANEKVPEFSEPWPLYLTNESINNLSITSNPDQVAFLIENLEENKCNNKNLYFSKLGLSELKKILKQKLGKDSAPNFYRICMSYRSTNKKFDYSEYIFVTLNEFDLSEISFMFQESENKLDIQEIYIPFSKWQFKPQITTFQFDQTFFYRYKIVINSKECYQFNNFSNPKPTYEITDFSISEFGNDPFSLCLILGNYEDITKKEI